MKKFKIQKLAFPVDGYQFNAQVWISVDGGKTYAYCGIGKFCKTEQEAQEFFEQYKQEVSQ